MNKVVSLPSGHAIPVPQPRMESLWMPFTANRQFKRAPRLLTRAAGVHFWTDEGRRILDGCAGLWCVNAGHAHPRIVEAIEAQARLLDYAPPFQMGHPLQFQVADEVAAIAPSGLDRIFFTNSGSESVDTALKIALAYHRARGEGSRTRFIGRERGYHGVGFGGMSVGGIGPNRRQFGLMLPGVDHLAATHRTDRRFTRGQHPEGAELADEMERLVALHDASSIAAVIVEPVAGSTGVLVPPVGYLQRLREICTRYGILLIFDEVITGFGRLGAPFAAQRFEVVPDLITAAKGLTNGAVPMGAVIAGRHVHDAIVAAGEGIEFFHGYTYSGHPLACAAARAMLQLCRDEALFERAAELEPYWEEAVHSLATVPGVVDVRNLGITAGIELEPRRNAPGARAFDVYLHCFEAGLLVRQTGDTIALSPPLTFERTHVDELVDGLSRAIRSTAP
jgi:beta-alanine--pyruvate transaminase